MKNHIVAILLLGSILMVDNAVTQNRDTRLRTKGYVNPQEIVSLDSTMRMDQALLVIGELSKQFAGKIIIDLEKRRTPIGVYIVNQHWRDALEMILARAGLTYQEEAEFIRIMPISASVEGMQKMTKEPGEPPPSLASRDVKISAVFFSTNVDKLTSYGISWDFFRSKPKEPKIALYQSAGIAKGDTLSKIPPVSIGPSLSKAFGFLSSPPEFTFANIDLLVKFFGQNQLGEVITSPEVVVRNGKKGKIQIGKNIFIVTKDISGNSISQQVSTGTIIDVVPMVYTQSDTDFIDLDISIEQSDAVSGETGPEISKTAVTTRALLYDTEESVIGGLYTTVDQSTREGIPFLKDLPPWFFGLRYLFGSESTVKQKNELIILLKAELLNPIRERIASKRTQQDLINMKRKENEMDYDKK
jgi:type IV pilus assembly protein PilQ